MESTASKDPRLASARRWYLNHRTEYAKLRKKRYATNPKLREKARADAAAYRQARREGLKVKRKLLRAIGNPPIEVEVFTIGYVADKLRCSAQLIRNWEARGWIPESSFPDQHRLYTKHQIELIRLLADTMRCQSKRYGLRAAQYEGESLVAPVVDLIHKMWSGVNNASSVHRKTSRRSR